MALWSILLVILFLCVLYVWTNDAKLFRTPPEALSHSPQRWTEKEIKACHAKLAGGPASLFEDKLPPKTGRRYIVVGGAGFLGGWIVLHLLQRGENPRRIRVLDLRPPVRRDLQVGAAREVDFVRVDITDAKAVLAAFKKPWPIVASEIGPDGAYSEPETTVFHTAATIRFYERHPELLYLSERINVHGTQNLLDAARSAGVRTFVYTSSGSVCVKRSRFWLWPWQKEPEFFVQSMGDDETKLPKRHEEFFSNYSVSKLSAERRVRSADRSTSGEGVMRTGCIRPGNGIFGPGGDLLAGAYLVQKLNLTWIQNVMQSFTFVENGSFAHLLYEQRLIELENGSTNPDIGGQSFCIADTGAPPTFGDIHHAINVLSNGEVVFIHLSITAMLGIAHLVEWYYLARYFLQRSSFRLLGKLMPAIVGQVVFLQPSMFALTQVHLHFNDSRARLPPEKGGLGYAGCTSLEGVCQVVIDHYRNGGKGTERVIAGHVETNHTPVVGAELAVGSVVEKLADPLDAVKAYN